MQITACTRGTPRTAKQRGNKILGTESPDPHQGGTVPCGRNWIPTGCNGRGVHGRQESCSCHYDEDKSSPSPSTNYLHRMGMKLIAQKSWCNVMFGRWHTEALMAASDVPCHCSAARCSSEWNNNLASFLLDSVHKKITSMSWRTWSQNRIFCLQKQNLLFSTFSTKVMVIQQNECCCKTRPKA